MVCVDRSCLLFLAVLLIITPSIALSAESGSQQSDHHIDNDSDRTKFRDKRTLDIILQGLAQMLGYRLQRNNAQTATIPQTVSPPTEPPKLVTHPTSAPPSQIVFLSVSDIADLKHKNTASSQGHAAVSDKNRHYPYSRYRDGSGKDENGDGYVRSDYSRGGHGKDGRGTEKSDKYYRSRFRSDKIDDYIQRIGQHSKGQFKSGKKDRDDEKMGQSSGKSDQFKNSGAGSDQKWDKERVESEYDKLKGLNRDTDNHKLSESQRNRGDANTAQEEQKEVTSKSDDDVDESSNEADSKSPENIKEKLEQNHREEETVEEEQQKSTQVNSEQEHNSKQESGENDSTDEKQGKQSKEEEHKDGDYHNQIPAPLQTWDEDFWNSRYSFADNNPYGFGLRDTQRSDKDEQKDKPSQSDYHYIRPDYFEDPGFEPVHEWHVSSSRQSEKPSFESSESQNELKEGEEEDEGTSHGSSDSEERTDPSIIENLDPSKPPIHGQDVTDKPPMPIHSTSRPKLVELIHEIEGTKQNPLWPPPFDHAFEGTDSSVDIQHPEQTNMTSSKRAPDHTSPLLLNLYNYTSISDYLLDLNKKDLLQKQPSRSSQQHTKIDHGSQNDDKSPVSYVAVVIPHKSRNKHVVKSDDLVPPKPSFVGVVYPQGLSSKYAEHALSPTSTKSDSIKDNRTPRFEPLTKSHISNPSQKLHRNDYDEKQDPPLETHYNPLFYSSSSLESSNSSGDLIQKFPDSYFSPFFHDPETHSDTNIQPQGIRTSSNSSAHDNEKLQHGAPYYRHLFQDPAANSKPSDRKGSSSALELKIPSNSPDKDNHYQNENIGQYFDSRYDNLFIQNPGTYPNTNPQTEGFSSILNSKSPNNYQKEETHYYPDTHYNSFLHIPDVNTKTNGSREGSPSVLNFRHPTNPSEETYSNIQNGNINHYPQFDYSSFQNVETQLLGSTFPHDSYNNDQGYHGDKTYNPSAVSSGGNQQVPSTPKPLRLVIPELQPHTLPDHQTSQLRVVIPDAPQSESSFDFSSGNEQNEPTNEAFEKQFGLITIPPPTPYSGHPASLKDPEKWVLGDDAPRTKNLKTKEHTIRVSKMRVSGKVHSQPNANLTEV